MLRSSKNGLYFLRSSSRHLSALAATRRHLSKTTISHKHLEQNNFRIAGSTSFLAKFHQINQQQQQPQHSRFNHIRLFSTPQAATFSLTDEEIPPSYDQSASNESDENTSNLNGIQDIFRKDESSIEEHLKAKGIRSRPVPNGNWKVYDPLKWTENFGRRSEYYYENFLKDKIQLKPGDEGYFDVSDLKVPNVSIVRTKEQAKIVLEKLKAADPGIFHACDTEVMDIDLNSVGPVGNGYVTCLSMYSGPDFDYGLGDGPGTSLWIDNLDDACGILNEFKEWFEDEKHLKVWHNYGFDRHVMWNEGIDVKGFGGDTMHMARLLDTSRENGYSLEALTADLLGRRKKPMKEIFGVRRLRKDGTEGNMIDLPAVEVMQRDPKYRVKWIRYSCFDAEGTWLVHEKLSAFLKQKPWQQGDDLYKYYFMHMRPFGEVLTDMERRGVRVDANEYLADVELQARKDRAHHLQVFREWAATQIGPDGLALNVASALQLRTFLFGGAAIPKSKDVVEAERVFKVPREEIPEDALEAYKKRDEEADKAESEEDKEPGDEFEFLEGMKAKNLKDLCKDLGLKVSGKKAELKERIKEHYLATAAKLNSPDKVDELDSMTLKDLRDSAIGRGLPTSGTKEDIIQRIRDDCETVKELEVAMSPSNNEGYVALSKILEAETKKKGALAEYLAEVKAKEKEDPKYIEVTIKSIGLQPEKYTAGGMPSVTADVLRKLAGDPFGDPPKYGSAFDAVGKEGCEALSSLCMIGSIDTMIANFLTTLQELADEQSRVHCSLNLNTETGRLSSRRPNLQNQPALEKDKYKIRKAFQASPGNNLIVADYGQLELRILASLTDCKAMIEAFEAGGDFHSRTALDMFPYIQEAVKSGECLLEWDYGKGDPPKPLLKDMFASERRKAKTLNFSIAYGKTAHGLSQDWGVSTSEAEEMLKAWYDSRPEVRDWQQKTKRTATDKGITRTLMGRYRQLPGAMGMDRRAAGHALRASINTPIQGGAADIAMMAMNKINDSQKLKDLGWILLLQVHDEVMLEGPEETAEEAFEEVLQCMQEPWVYGLRKTSVPLLVDGSCKHKTWYDAK